MFADGLNGQNRLVHLPYGCPLQLLNRLQLTLLNLFYRTSLACFISKILCLRICCWSHLVCYTLVIICKQHDIEGKIVNLVTNRRCRCSIHIYVEQTIVEKNIQPQELPFIGAEFLAVGKERLLMATVGSTACVFILPLASSALRDKRTLAYVLSQFISANCSI